jgi:hypothetical protein
MENFLAQDVKKLESTAPSTALRKSPRVVDLTLSPCRTTAQQDLQDRKETRTIESQITTTISDSQFSLLLLLDSKVGGHRRILLSLLSLPTTPFLLVLPVLITLSLRTHSSQEVLPDRVTTLRLRTLTITALQELLIRIPRCSLPSPSLTTLDLPSTPSLNNISSNNNNNSSKFLKASLLQLQHRTLTTTTLHSVVKSANLRTISSI